MKEGGNNGGFGGDDIGKERGRKKKGGESRALLAASRAEMSDQPQSYASIYYMRRALSCRCLLGHVEGISSHYTQYG